MTDVFAYLDSRWAFYLGCSEGQLRDGGRHVVPQPPTASQEGSPWPLRQGPICVFSTGQGWVMSVPNLTLDLARSLCVGYSFEELVSEGDRLHQEWFDRGETNAERGPHRGDEGYGVMNRVAASVVLRGWSHYIHSYADPNSWAPQRDEHVRQIMVDRPELWRQWQRWPGPMVGPEIEKHFEVADAFGYILDGHLVSAAQIEASSADSAWEYGVDTLPEYRGRGYATAVLRAITATIIERGRIPWHYCDHYNRPSRRLPQKLGYFRYGEGLFSHFHRA